MALVIADYVVETASNPGTGTVNLGGAATGRRTFVGAIGSGNTTFYYITDGSQAEWGLGTVTSGTPNTLSRDTVIGNTAGTTSKLNFTGTVTVYAEVPAARRLHLSGTGAQVRGVPSGSASAPGLPFDVDTDTGLYRHGADDVGIAAGGVVIGRFRSGSAAGQRNLVVYDPTPLAAGVGAGITLRGVFTAAGGDTAFVEIKANKDNATDGNSAASAEFRIHTGSAIAVALTLSSTQQALAELGSAAAPGLSFRGDTDTGLFRPTGDAIGLAGAGAEQLRIVAAASAVNRLEAAGAAAGSGPQLSAAGSDTNIDLRLAPKGTGRVRYGTHSAIGAETVTGYITIRDAGGTERKLAVVS